MSRILLPRLFEMGIAPVLPQGGSLTGEQSDGVFEILGIRLTDNHIPLALRWRLHPDIGVPRLPFKVWRRSTETTGQLQSLPLLDRSVDGTRRIEWNRTPFYELRLEAVPTQGQNLRIQALDDRAQPIVGEYVIASDPDGVSLRFRAANICALQVTGHGEISDLTGVSMVDMANDSAWVLTETVGLPVEPGDSSLQAYDSAATQGLPLPGNNKTGLEAALDRLRVAQLFYSAGPDSAPQGITPPDWPAPDPSLFVSDELRGQGRPLDLILQMLDSIAPNPSSLNQTQTGYEHSMILPGMRQPGASGAQASDSVEISVPVAAIALISAAWDMWAALGLGFGTTDFPAISDSGSDLLEPEGTPMPGIDYMVTFDAQLPLGLNLELAALGSLARMRPPTPMNFGADTWLRNRPAERDGPISYEVELQWRRLPSYVPPHGYALGLIAGNAPAQVLNEPRPSENGFAPFIPTQAAHGDRGHEEMASYIDNVRPAPLGATRSDSYLGAALDVFGRWSEGWAVAAYESDPQEPAKPHILKAELELQPQSATGRSVPASLEVELVWDWEDRSPHQIELVGHFYTGATAPADAPKGIATTATGRMLRPLVMQFTGNDLDQTPTENASLAEVEALPAQPEDGEARRYRVRISKLQVDFSASSRVTYAVYARASELVDPGRFSDYSPPTSATAIDPLPAEPPLLEGEAINWTALPDATGAARYRLTFDSVPHAAGYAVYEATEAAMLHAGASKSTGDLDLSQRASQLAGIASQEEVRDTYSRLNRELLDVPQIDLELPGASRGLSAYRVSSVTAEQVESELSQPILVAVPRRITPGAPILQLRRGAGVVEARIESGAGPAPDHVELYRTQSPILVSELDTMGPPVADRDAAWTLTEDAETGRRTFELQDPVSPSWLPYHYRAVALGPSDAAAGVLPGRSQASAAMQVVLPPSEAPDLQELTLSLDNGLARVRFRSSAEIRTSPLGEHLVTISTVSLQALPLARTTQVRAHLPAIAERVDPNGTPTAGLVTRGDIDSDGRWLYEAHVPADDDQILVRLTDPMGRLRELSDAMPGPAIAPPDKDTTKGPQQPSTTLQAPNRNR